MQIVAVSVELGQRAADVAIASHQTTLNQLPAQQRVPHKPIHQCFFVAVRAGTAYRKI